MADETQNAPVAGANETTTQENEKKMYVYYFSDPDATDQKLRFHEIYTDVAFDELPWHVHTEKPDESLKDPVWDINTNGWVENSKDGQAQILAEATQKIAELNQKSTQLDQANEKVDQTLRDMQEVQAQSSQQNVALMKSFTEQTQNTNKMLATMQQTLAMVVKSTQKDATPEAPKADDKADQASDTKQENGGN